MNIKPEINTEQQQQQKNPHKVIGFVLCFFVISSKESNFDRSEEGENIYGSISYEYENKYFP